MRYSSLLERNRPIGRHDWHRLASSFKSGRVSSSRGIVILRRLFIVSQRLTNCDSETTTDDWHSKRSMISIPFLQRTTTLSCKNTTLYASEGIAKSQPCLIALITRGRSRDRLYAYSVHQKPSRTGKTGLGTERTLLADFANSRCPYAKDTPRLSPM